MIVFGSGLLFHIYAQGDHLGFNKTYELGKNVKFQSIVSDSTNLYVTAIYRDGPLSSQAVALFALDTLGDLRWSYIINDDSSAISMALESTAIYTSDKQIVVIYTYLYRTSIGISSFSKNGDLNWQQEFNFPKDLAAIVQEVVELNNGFLIAGGVQDSTFNLNMFLIKTDSVGNKLWTRRYGEPALSEYPQSIVVLNSTTYLVCGVSTEDEVDIGSGWAIKIDSSGEQIWDWIADTTELPHRAILSVLYDSAKEQVTYLTSLQRVTNYPGEDFLVSVPLLVTRDTIMNLVKYTEYGPYAYTHYLGKLAKSGGDELVGVGKTTLTGDDFISPVASQHGRVVKMSCDGTLLWSIQDTALFDKNLGSRGHLAGVTVTHTGSIYAAGWADGEGETGLRSFGWLLKITSGGCIDSCTTSAAQQQPPSELITHVFPNPALDRVFFNLSQLTGRDYIINIYSLDGRRVYVSGSLDYPVHLINTSEWNPGIYTWIVTDELERHFGTGKLIISR